MSFIMQALTYIDQHPIVGVSKTFLHVMSPYLLEQKTHSSYNMIGPEIYGSFEFIDVCTVYAQSPYSVYIRSLVYSGEPSLKRLIPHMTLKHLETFPRYLKDFDLSCLESLVLFFDSSPEDDIPIKIGSIKSLLLEYPNNKTRLYGHIDYLKIYGGSDLSPEIFMNLKSVGRLEVWNAKIPSDLCVLDQTIIYMS